MAVLFLMIILLPNNIKGGSFMAKKQKLTSLRLWRQYRGYSVSGIASALGITQPAYSQVELGHRQAWPRLKREVSRLLAVPENVLFDEGGALRPVELEKIVNY